MSYRIVGRPETSQVTREIARSFAGMEAAPQDRPLSERRLQVYEREMVNGTFRPVTWAKVHCLATGEDYRVNGKHTSTLLAGLANLPQLFVTIETYEADSLEDVARLYSTFDARIQLRTTADINRSFAATVPEFAVIPARLINLAVTGISLATWGKMYGDTPAAERAETMLDHVDFLVWLHSMIPAVTFDSRKLCRGPVIGAMFSTYQKSRKDSTAFWSAVRDESGDNPGKPDRRLAKYLTLMSVAVGQGSQAPRSRSAPQMEFYVKCLHAWNAWRKKTTTDLKYIPSAKPPSVI
jgi:hypothetical protein